MNINAGSDTIASTLRAIFYHLLKNPASLSQLMAELDLAAKEDKLSTPCPTWTETQQNLPYLRAVVKEGLRMNPALSLPLERVVPKEGLTLQHEDGTTPTFLPQGTVVGINPWVFHRSPAIFGTTAEQWNPSRWLSAEECETKSMEHSLLAFGAGKRSCLGKNIAMLELHKLVPAMLLRFQIELADPAKEWEVSNAWVLNHTGLNVKLVPR
jgi:cytochrome P450